MAPLRRTASSLTAPLKGLKVVSPPSPILHCSLPATFPSLTKPAAVAPWGHKQILPQRRHMVRLDLLRPCGQSCRSPATAATSSGCYRTAATAPLSIASSVVEAFSEEDTQVEKQVVMRIEGLEMLMLMDMSLRWSPNPNVLMKGLMLFMLITLIKLAHTHIKLAHLIALILSNSQVSNFRNLLKL